MTTQMTTPPTADKTQGLPGATGPREAEMPLREHLVELRLRIIRSMGAILVMSLICIAVSDRLLAIVTAPIRAAFGELQMIGTGPADAFIVGLQVSVLAGFLLSSPFVFFQGWRFIEPGLLDKEKRMALPFVFFSTLFFMSGVLFCYYLMLPFAFSYFYDQFVSYQLSAQIKIDEYLSFVIKMVLVFGFVFELPIVSYFLARVGILTHTWLIKQARLSIVIIFVVAGILTPPDVVSQLCLAAPLLTIYLMSIGIAYYFNPKVKR